MKNIIFMGSPEFAIPSLQSLISNQNFNIKSVYTRAPKPSGRGHKLSKTAVHILAEENGIEVLTPTTLKNHIMEDIDLIVLVAYSLLIPKHILDKPKYGCINVHPSLLPRWRGASPIESAILAGDELTGVSIMKMNEYMDEGDVFTTTSTAIESCNFVDLHNKLAIIGANELIKVLENIENLIPITQPKEGITHAKKIHKTPIDWNNTANYIEREIRALSGKDFYFNGKLLKILAAKYVDENHNVANGEIINKNLHIACLNSILIPLIVQPEGKKPMAIEAFLNGVKFP